MFCANEEHKQSKMFTAVDQLPQTARKKLEASWASVFYEEFFSRLDEEVFSVLYSEKKSRPNTPANILVGFETLKSGFGWSDEELYNHFLFDLQVRYALGLRDFEEGYFDLRTLYYFRAALVEYERKHEINLIQKASEQITDEQIQRLKRIYRHFYRSDLNTAQALARIEDVEPCPERAAFAEFFRSSTRGVIR